jgi:hypothetical protein
MTQKGIEDAALMLSPDLSFWKRTFKKPAEWASEHTDVGVPNAIWGKQYQTKIPICGDLIRSLSLVFDVNLLRHRDYQQEGFNPENAPYFTNSVGRAALLDVTLQSSSFPIDELDGRILELKDWTEKSSDKDTDKLVLRSKSVEQLQKWSYYGNTLAPENAATNYSALRIYSKLNFYFTMADSQSIPAVTMQFSDLILRHRTRNKADLVCWPDTCNATQLDNVYNGEINELNVLVDNIFVGPVERYIYSTYFTILSIFNFYLLFFAGNFLSPTHTSTLSETTPSLIFTLRRRATLVSSPI